VLKSRGGLKAEVPPFHFIQCALAQRGVALSPEDISQIEQIVVGKCFDRRLDLREAFYSALPASSDSFHFSLKHCGIVSEAARERHHSPRPQLARFRPECSVLGESCHAASARPRTRAAGAPAIGRPRQLRLERQVGFDASFHWRTVSTISDQSFRDSFGSRTSDRRRNDDAQSANRCPVRACRAITRVLCGRGLGLVLGTSGTAHSWAIARVRQAGEVTWLKEHALRVVR
jgi:hypothetical protein